MRSSLRPAAIVLAIAAVAAGHYLTDPTHFVLHNVYQRLYYVPLLLAALWYGLRGGLLAAAGCAASYAPHIVIHWAGHQSYQVSQLVELVMFLVVGVLAGVLTDRERSLRRRAESLAAERDRALRDLEETVETLRQADRLATLGTLAASLAHEVRNPLGSLAGAVEILARDYPEGHPRREFVDILQRELGRLGATVSRYLDFARPQAPQLRPVDLNQAVVAAVELVERGARRAGVRVVTQVASGSAEAQADPVQVHQVLVNLLVNGIQAMPEGGTLEVAVTREEAAVVVKVRDHGLGLPPGSEERMFEPFFTTRLGGTGLGLAIARQIVATHGGTLTAANANGGGAELRLSVPSRESRRSLDECPPGGGR